MQFNGNSVSVYWALTLTKIFHFFRSCCRLSRASLKPVADRMWPAGRSLPTFDLDRLKKCYHGISRQNVMELSAYDIKTENPHLTSKLHYHKLEWIELYIQNLNTKTWISTNKFVLHKDGLYKWEKRKKQKIKGTIRYNWD